MNTFEPYSWNVFLGECLLYFGVMGVFHLAIFAVGSAVLAVTAIWQRGTLAKRVRRFGLFLGLLLMIGSIANGMWSCLIFGRLYYSTDYTFDFSPLWPITQELIDAPFGEMRGQLLGVSLLQLQFVWLVFAASTWTITILSYRLICGRSEQAKISLRTA